MVLLTKRERNQIFEIVAANVMETGSCKLLDPSHHLVLGSRVQQATMQHEATSSHFTFWREEGEEGYHVQSDVGEADWDHADSISWDALMVYLASWAEEVAYEIDTPDRWTELQQVPEVMAAAQSADASNAHFSAREQAEIWRRLDLVKRLVRQRFDLTDEQLATIDQRLDDAREACGRLGRKDWIMLFYGAVISTAMTDAVPPHVIQTVLTTVLLGISHIFGFGGGPPVIGT